jgi:hypothetical protein
LQLSNVNCTLGVPHFDVLAIDLAPLLTAVGTVVSLRDQNQMVIPEALLRCMA